MLKSELIDIAKNKPIGSKICIDLCYFTTEQNEAGCLRAVCDCKATDEDKAFFISRSTALGAYTAALSAQDYNVNIINSIQKTQFELLQFIGEKKKELNLENTDLDFDGNVYFIQISHGPGCKNH